MGLHSNSVGVLKDIGRSGLRIEYLSQRAAADQWKMIDILSNRKDRVLMASVPCQVVYDIKDMASNRSFTGLDVRLCGVCFGQLTAGQRECLCRLLDGGDAV